MSTVRITYHKKSLNIIIYIIKQNANAFSLNAIVDFRLRRQEVIFFNISETTQASNIKS